MQLILKEHQESEDSDGVRTVLTDKDLNKMMDVVDDFRTRHSTITESINDAYRIGNQLLDYVEKQVIIDYHLKGQQAKMEKDHPKLVKKAKKWMGM